MEGNPESDCLQEPSWHKEGCEKGAPTVVAVDCGLKANQLRCLNKRGLAVRVVPFDYPFAAELHSTVLSWFP